MKRVILNNDSSINSMLEGLQELIELNTPSTADFVDDIEYSEKTDYWNGSEFISIGNPPTPNHTFDYAIKEWVDLRTLDEIKAQKWAEIKSERDRIEFGGFEFDGDIYDSDQVSQGRILGASIAGVDKVWTLADNSTRLLTASRLQRLCAAMQTHTASVHQRGRIAREAIMSATTKEDVEAVTL
ncbi:DUF4376 domain-containing protein [Acinetobacter sp. SA01]|uniref:DUF4376 domain-containing protein n=1 Tax=Acinetobacter sp. SA01 TaxID=1862567 RepID=UPI001F102CDE|nr:DUF4376 domain-containing protein [Acinetobacter sp. SA01]